MRFSGTSQGEVYHLDFFHINQEWNILKLTWVELENFIEFNRNYFLRNNLNSPFKPIPNFIHGSNKLREFDTGRRLHNASAVIEFLIEKGGVFIMLPPQERVKEVPNE